MQLQSARSRFPSTAASDHPNTLVLSTWALSNPQKLEENVTSGPPDLQKLEENLTSGPPNPPQIEEKLTWVKAGGHREASRIRRAPLRAEIPSAVLNSYSQDLPYAHASGRYSLRSRTGHAHPAGLRPAERDPSIYPPFFLPFFHLVFGCFFSWF